MAGRYDRTVKAALSETMSKFVLAEALALDIPARRSRYDGEQSIDDCLLEARKAIIAKGGEPKSPRTLKDYRTAAMFVKSESNETTTFRWITGVSFMAHKEAANRDIEYETFAILPKKTVDGIGEFLRELNSGLEELEPEQVPSPERGTVPGITGPPEEVPRPDEPDDEPAPQYKRQQSRSRPQKKKHTVPFCINCERDLVGFDLKVAIAARSETNGRTLCDECRLAPEPEPEPQLPVKRLEAGTEPDDRAEWSQFSWLLHDATEKLREAAMGLIGLKYSDDRYSEILGLLESVDEDIRDFHKWGQENNGRLRLAN